MIIRVKNIAEYEQQVTLHTGESKTIDSQLSIRINTGNDARLIKYYASLINFNFDVSVVSASDEEINRFNDALTKFHQMNESTNPSDEIYPNKVLEEKHLTAITDRDYTSDPKVLRSTMNIPRSEESSIVMDSHSGTIEYNANIPKDALASEIETVGTKNSIPEVVIENKITDNKVEVTEAEHIDEVSGAGVEDTEGNNTEVNEDYNKLDSKFDESTLKYILEAEFNEVSKARAKWKLINRILELATNVDELIAKYSK